jgi:hypothetical protein
MAASIFAAILSLALQRETDRLKPGRQTGWGWIAHRSEFRLQAVGCQNENRGHFPGCAER